MARAFSGSRSRRDFLRMTTSLGTFGIVTSLTPDLLFAQTKTDLSGIEIDYWNMIGVQNKLVKQLSESIIKAYEQRTGAKVNTTWNSYGDIIGPKYRTNFQGGIKPTVMDAVGRWTGQLREFLRPMNDLIDSELDPATRDGLSWVLPLVEQQNSGFSDADQIRDLPFALIPQCPYIVRKDHFEQAGIDFDANFPIRDTDHYIELCKELQGSGIQFPTEVYGKIWDFGDTQLNGWVRSLTKESDFLNADWTRCTANSEAWIQAVQFYVDVFQKHGLSSPNSPQSTDEEAVELFIRGQKSIVHADILNRGTLLDKMADQMADGTVQWGPHFPITGGTTGSQCVLGTATFEIVKQEGEDAEIKELAAWEFIKEWLLAENQVAYAKTAGLCVRQDMWDQLKGAPDGYAEATIPMLEGAGVWSNHPRSVDFQYNLLAPHGQKALQGASVEAEMKAYAAEVNEALQG